jgi:hypothetical protein
MQTQHNSLGVTKHDHTYGEFLDRMARYEAAVKAVFGTLSDNGPEAVKELSSARQSLADLNRVAKAAFDAKFEAVNDRPMGKALKDWATAIMAHRHITRDNARAWILDAIKVMTGIENEQPNFTEVDREAVDANIRATHPDFRGVQLDHLPEGSH